MENRSLLSGTPLDGIDYGVYTASLMRRAADAGLLDERALAAMQEGLLGLLRSQIEEITRGESSSVPAETADQLMDDIGYCIDVALKHAPTPQESLALLREHSMDALYRMGTGLLDREERACEGLLSRVRATRTPTVNEGYRILLDVTFPQYLRDWKVRRHPGDFVVLTEYPLGRSPRAGSSACASGSSRSRWRTASAADSHRCWTACCAAGRAKTAPPPPRPM